MSSAWHSGLPLAALLACLWLVPAPARAATTCTATAPGALAFGTITNGAAAPTNVMVSFKIQCSTVGLSLLADASVRVCVGIGTGSTGTTLSPFRGMTNTFGDTMSFQLYTNAARTIPWGLLPGGTPPAQIVDLKYPVPVLGGNGEVTLTLYGQIPANQALAFGSYTSSFSGSAVTLEYAYNEVLLGGSTTPATCTAGTTGHKTATDAFPFTVTANVLAQCSATVATDMDFGSRAGSIASAIDQTSTITTTCLKRTPFTVALDNGLYAGGTSVRRMRHVTNAAYTIPYELYRDSARTLRWGTTQNVDTLAQTGTGSAQPITVYGRAPATVGAVAEGSYNDRVQVTITF
ncbi:spore coat protein U domain-containing protein [Stenotrophomonas sp.]|uniref:Csu type fimbrial protein n=1 Tax=Stenotrophomonas sp. TaxID=69392 RepID=UPI0028AF8A4F|nr:spore coat protein U domain-containing protein [Stenotrophomonas sp.]